MCIMYISLPNVPNITEVPGAPTEDVLTKWYANGAGVSHPLSNWPFFKALDCFRLAAIAQV